MSWRLLTDYEAIRRAGWYVAEAAKLVLGVAAILAILAGLYLLACWWASI